MRPEKLPGGAAGRVLASAMATALVLAGSGLAPGEARAQSAPIVFDGTIGNVSPGDEPLFSAPDYVITDDFGAFSGRNLFFSFDRFGVPSGSTAFFFDQTFSAQAVIARVTGARASEVFGGIDTGQYVPGADFFLLNPQGIYVGPDASLNVGGSTYLATADRLHWGPDGTEYFSAQVGDPASVMSDTDPIAFGFLSDAPAPVGIYGADLDLGASSRFGVAGGVVEVVGTEISKESGLVELAAVRGNPGELLLPLDFAELDAQGQALGPVRLGLSELRGDPGLPSAVALILADLSDAPSTLDVSANTTNPRAPGAVVIRGDRFVMRGGEVKSLAAAASPVPVVADYAVDVEVDGELALEAGAEMRVENVSGTAEGGAIRLAAATVRVEGDSQVAAQNTGAAAGGEIQVQAVQEVSVRDGGQIFSQAVDSASAPGGDVSVRVSGPDGRILVQGARPAQPGEDGPRVSQISALTETSDDGGNGGALLLDAALVEVRNGAQVRTSTLGAGDAGDLEVTAAQLVVSGAADVGESLPVGSGLFALTRNVGEGGDLSVVADEVSVENGARVSASSQPSAPDDNLISGPAGNLKIVARRVTVRGGPDGSSVVLAEAQAEGEAGDLVVRADELELVDGGALSTLTTSTGDAGDIDVAARRILISGAEETGMFAQNRGGGNAGDAGSVVVSASELLRMENGGEISVASIESGIAGDVSIHGGGDVELSDGASIRATLEGDLRPVAEGEDPRADVRIEDVRSLSLSDATITTETFESGDGGDVLVRTSGPVTLDHGSTITARSTSPEVDAGNAGSIEIDAGTTLALVRGSRLETSALGGSGGSIRLGARDLVYLSDAGVATEVSPPGAGDPTNAGDVVLALPTLAVLNRSSIVALARESANAGNIQVTTRGAFFPSDPLLFAIEGAPAGASVLDATAETGIAGTIEIVSPTADLVSQVTPLPVEFFDASQLLTTPCEARRARRGSLTVQTRRALEPPPDALFGADSVPAAAPAGECPTT